MKKIWLQCVVAICSYFTVSGMEIAEVCVPSPGGDHFVRKNVSELTASDFEKIHSNPAYENQLLEMLRQLQVTLITFQQQEITSVDSFSILSGTISAIHDYLIDEADSCKIPTVCSLMEDLIEQGVSEDNPDLLFFRGVILYNSKFLSKVPPQHLSILTGGKEAESYVELGLSLIKQAASSKCSDAIEYLNNI